MKEAAEAEMFDAFAEAYRSAAWDSSNTRGERRSDLASEKLDGRDGIAGGGQQDSSRAV